MPTLPTSNGMKPDDLKKSAKLFAENIKVGFTPEYFVMGFTSGNQGSIYSFTPQHAKRLQQYLSHQLTEFETKHGEINAKWDPKIKSPVQRVSQPRDGS